VNYRQVIKKLGILVILVGAFMATSLVWAALDYHQDGSKKNIFAFISSVIICLLVGFLFLWIGRRATGEILRKEAIAIVGFGWLICGLLGALPFILSGVMTRDFTGPFDICASAIFESCSGFTTTGASIFPSPQDLPRAILFWRSLTHWLGGMGIVVLFVAVLGGTGAGAKFLFSSEVPGPIAESLRPRIRSTAILLWKIYIGISAAQVLCLFVQGMNLFDSLCHTFGTMATGGFSTKNGSIGQYKDLGFEITIIVFMILAGINFNLHAAFLQRRWKAVLKNKEFRVYMLLLLIATLLLTTDLIANGVYTIGSALRYASFQAVAIMTTTGYGTADFDRWPSFSRWFLVMLMFVGGSAGSTGGGIKVIRIMLFVRIVKLEVERTFRPHIVRPLKVGGQDVGDDMRRAFGMYIGIVLVIFFVATLLLMVLHNEYHVDENQHMDMETAFSAVAATLNNIGPGLGMVGSTQNYAFFTPAAKILLTLLMIIGRLEVMVILCLFVPGFYRRN
jgi:trk/ktr system potassium uptake protein